MKMTIVSLIGLATAFGCFILAAFLWNAIAGLLVTGFIAFFYAWCANEVRKDEEKEELAKKKQQVKA